MDWGKGIMKGSSKYLLINEAVLPEVFLKVMAVKKLLSFTQMKSINQAVKEVGMSRSAYYKYKDYVFPFYESPKGMIILIHFVLEDSPGVLSGIITKIAKSRANIITINQNIPLDGFADVTISINIDSMVIDIGELLEQMTKMSGVKRCEILARD
jgi:chorismate mutase